MQETEVKVLEINHQEIVKKIQGHNGTLVFDGDVSTMFLDYADSCIHQKRDVLRLRKENDAVELTYKKVRFEAKVKVAEETTVLVSNLESTLSILRNLGLDVKERMEKHRTSYMFMGVRVDIDRYVGVYSFIPEFLELEGPQKAIEKAALLLGFSLEDCLPWSTDELIKHYRSKGKKEKV